MNTKDKLTALEKKWILYDVANSAFTLLISTIIVSLDGFSFETNFTAVVATLSNIGPGLGMVGPTGNFAAFSNLSKLVLSMCMLIGRLEIFPILMLFAPSAYKR